MSDRQNWSRLVASIFALTLVSAFAFAAFAPKYYTSLFTAEATSLESGTVPQAGTILADDPVIGTCDTAGPIEVESSGGTTTPTAYGTLKLAFDAIIAGTHTGAIDIEVCGNTTETATAALTASGVGAASYTSVTIRPVGGSRVIEGTIVGAIVRLQGADNVTIDGRQGGVGTARDLTVRNTSTSTATAAIWLSSVAAGNGASSNVIRNLEIAAGQTANAGTNTTIGVYMGGTTISLTATDGNDNDNNQFLFNRIIRARYGIATRGVTTNNDEGLVIADNIIGPNSFGADEIGKVGIYLQADTGALITRNTVQFVGGDVANTTAGADRCGICVGSESWSATDSTTITSGDYTVTKNVVHDIVEERLFSSVGIKLGTTRSGTATNNLVANNFIYNLRANGTGGDQPVGIGYTNGHTDKIVFNSISMTGDVDPGAAGAATTYGNAIRVTQANGTNNVNLTLMNNSIYLDASSSSTAAQRYYAITLNSAAYVFGTGGLNYNNYYINPANTQLQTGGLGTNTASAITTQFATLANWQAALTAPQDANSIQADPLHFSSTSDLHIQTASPNINVGTAVAGIVDDIDSQVRPNGANPDIGADEFYTSPGTLQLSSNAYSAAETAGMITITVTRAGGANGAASVDYSTGGGTATAGGSCGGSVDYVTTSGTLMWADLDVAPKMVNVPICADGTFDPTETFNVTLSNAVTATLGTPSSAVASIFDAGSTFNGSINVGSGETVTSLTNVGGLFSGINNGSVTGNLTINITSDLAGETGSVLLNEIPGGFTVTIRPSGAARTISGTSGATAGLLGFNSADGVTIDGSTSGGSDRSLTIMSGNVGTTGGGIYFASGANGAQNNTVKNVNVFGNGSTTGVLLGIAFGSSTFGGVGVDNDNNRVENCDVRGAFYGIASLGASAANKDTGLVVTRNVLPAVGTAGIGRVGIYVVFADGAQITQNNIASVSNPGSVDTIGIAAGSQAISNAPLTAGGVSNALISRNYVGVVTNNATFSSAGIVVASDTTGTNNVTNNMVTGVTGNANAGDIVVGIYISPLAGSTQNVYHNSVSMTGDRGSTTANLLPSYALAIGSDQPVNVANNILFNSQTKTGATGGGGESYAIGFDGPAANVNLVSNTNDLFVSGPIGVIGITGDLTTAAQTTTAGTGTNQATLAAWQAATTEDAMSISSDPLFTSLTDLHIPMGSPVVGVGGTGTGVTVDFDGQTRDGMPDIGADELVAAAPGTLAFSSATYSVGEAGPTVTLTVNRTGGTDGAVNVDYALSGGTATGGASCGGAVDYVNTGGTVMFANGETSKTFNVAICNDAVYEGDETFNATLSNATGGATIGSPNPAAVTITDNETVPTVQFSSATYTITEGLVDSGSLPTATITVTLSGPSQSAASVNYATVAGGTATGGASCTAGIDYVNTSGTLNFVAGDVSETFFVSTCPDAVDESDETVNMALSTPVGTTLGIPNTAVLTINDNDGPAGPTCEMPSIGNIEVQATAGTPGPTGYATLGDAFTAINTNVHQGAITIDVCGNTTEAATAALTASGVGGTYTSIRIAPVGGARIIEGAITGAIVRLNGADNVTIDGRLGGTGTSRDLTIRNNQSAAATAAIWLSSVAAGNGASNNTIRNLEIAAGANQSTGVLASFGIIMSGTTIAVGANGEDNDNNSFIANQIIRARYGITTRSNPANLAANTIVTDNIVGPSSFGADEIGKVGIFMQADSGAVVSRNTVQFVGGPFASTTGGADRVGIALGVESWGSAPTTLAGANYTVTRNVVHDVIEERTFSSLGILLSVTNGASPTNNLVANNFVYNVNANGTVGDTAVGIGVAAGDGDRIVFNSVRMAGDSDPNAGAAVPTQNPMNLRVAGAPTNLTVKNNSLYNDVFSSSAPTLQSANIQLPSATFAFGTGGLNNNNYYFPPSNTTARTGAVGTTSVPTAFFATLANWQAAVTPQDANSIQADPQYVSATDLHIALGSPNVNAGATGTGVVNDIDFQVRDAMPDIGADEPNGATAPANDIAAVSIVTPAPGSTLINGTATTPQARFYNAGSATQTGVMVQFTITGPGGYNYTNTQSIATIASDEFVTVTFATAPTFTMAGAYMMSAQVITADGNPANDMVSGSFTVIDPLNGTYTVGTAGQFTSLTNPGGFFDVLNTAGASGNITAEITSDLTGETGAIPLNQLPGGFGLTIKPTGAARTISGTAASLSMIKLNGADNVTIDGSLSGGTDRSLTLLYTNTGGTVVWIAAMTGNGANNNTVKNCVIASNPGTVTVAGILGGSGTTLGGPAEAPNNNNTVTNNQIFRVQNSIYNQGNTGLDQNWVITGNTFGSNVVADKNSFRGMLMGNAQNFTISGNVVSGISSTTTTTAAMTGIQLAFNVNTGMVANNRISDIRNNSATGTGAFGMQLSASPTVNVTIANNFISDAITLGSATIVNNGHGINVNGAASAGGYKIYHNSINMNTNQTTGTTSALNVTAAVVAAGALDVRNNIFANTQTSGATRRAVHSAAAASVFGTINYNDYFSTGSVGFIGGLDRPTLADWQTGTGQDANSKAVDPLFVSPTDLHIQPASPMISMGVPGTGITTDIDGQTRDAVPDIGADEIVGGVMPGSLQFSSPTYSVGEAGGTATITVTRTGGTDGTVTVDYATVAGGTATGGASCTAGIDYINASGTLTFIGGDNSETFNVTICNDAVSEANETVNMALSNVTGGATIGSPSTAVLTITDDDVPPGSLSINDVRMFEGNSGSRNFVFTVTYTGPTVPVSVQYATANGTATAGVDYLAASGTVTFNSLTGPEGLPAPQTATITVVVNGETVKEANETFFVNLSSPTGATIADGQGVGIIIDEDRAYVADFDLDRIADFSVFRPTEGRWYVLQSTTLTPKIVDFGENGDIAVPGDYDGDGIADMAIFRPSTGQWYRILSTNASTQITSWGVNGDKPVQGDYDGDGKTDLAVFRPSTGTWWILRSSNGSSSATTFGISTDRPVQGDYDGDAKTDIAVYRDGIWYILRSSDAAVQTGSFGIASDKPVSGDFDGDGKYDLAIYRNGVWWVLRSLTGTAIAVPWGTTGDIPVPADYDADGTTDFAVFRPSAGDWFVIRSSNSTSFGAHWGVNGDVPIPAAYLPQ